MGVVDDDAGVFFAEAEEVAEEGDDGDIGEVDLDCARGAEIEGFNGVSGVDKFDLIALVDSAVVLDIQEGVGLGEALGGLDDGLVLIV